MTARFSARPPLLAALAGWLLACGPAGGLSDTSPGEIPVPPVRLQTVLFEGFGAGSRQVEVRAARARIEPVERIAHLDRVRIAFHDADRGPVDIRAERGTIDMSRDDFVLRGQVTGATGEGERFTTAEVRYDAAQQRLWTDQPVRIHRSNFVLDGDGMELDVATRHLRISGNVRTTLESR